MPAPTIDILWIEVAAFLKRRTDLATQPWQLRVDLSTLRMLMSS